MAQHAVDKRGVSVDVLVGHFDRHGTILKVFQNRHLIQKDVCTQCVFDS
jgi:hypothetical protein